MEDTWHALHLLGWIYLKALLGAQPGRPQLQTSHRWLDGSGAGARSHGARIMCSGMTAVGKGKDGMKEGKESAHGSGQKPEGQEGKESAHSAASSGQQSGGRDGKEPACRADTQGPVDRGPLCIMDARGAIAIAKQSLQILLTVSGLLGCSLLLRAQVAVAAIRPQSVPCAMILVARWLLRAQLKQRYG